MRRTPLIYDGLWRCLCPAFDRGALFKAVQTQIPSRALPPSTTTTRHATTRQQWVQKRHFGGESMATPHGSPGRNNSNNNTWPDSESRERQLSKALDDVLLAPTPPTESTLDGIATEELVIALKKIRDPAGYSLHGQEFDRHGRILQIVGHLVGTRDLAVDVFVYECVMDAMIDPQGSAEAVRALFNRMDKEAMIPTETICRSALAALAVHPDYALRKQVLDTMRERWFHVDTPADQNFMLGMLRDGQYELAYDRFMGSVERGERIDLWAYDIFIMVFGHEGFLDEMMQLLYRRKHAKGSDPVAMSLTYYALDLCSSASHYQGTTFAWNSLVRNGQLQPSDGILENVLATAAREGDVNLATEVHGMISARSRVQIHHYEALIEAFARDGNVSGALRILCIMEQSGLTVFRENTRAVYEALRQDAGRVRDAEAVLRDMAASGRVPLGAISVVLEAKAKLLGREAASSLYDDVQNLSGREPSATMIQDMIINSKKTERTAALLNDYKEKISVHEKPPARLPGPYSKLISACLECKELDLAMRFGDQALLPQPSRTEVPPWLRKLTEAAIAAEDGRIWDMFDRFKEAGNTAAVETMQRMSRLMQLARRMQDKKKMGAAGMDPVLNQLNASRRVS